MKKSSTQYSKTFRSRQQHLGLGEVRNMWLTKREGINIKKKIKPWLLQNRVGYPLVSTYFEEKVTHEKNTKEEREVLFNDKRIYDVREVRGVWMTKAEWVAIKPSIIAMITMHRSKNPLPTVTSADGL